MSEVLNVGIGLIASGLIGVVGWWRRVLAPSGVVGAAMVGTAVFAFGGLAWATLLIGFFGLSSALSGAGRTRKAELATVATKGSQRDLGQVLANGGLGAALAVLYASSGTPAVFAAFLGAMASVNADTWSTEIGGLSASRPRSIVTGQAVSPGTSGGVTALGIVAALAGGLAMGLIAIPTRMLDTGAAAFTPTHLMLVGVAAGLAGSVVDSLLGATIQQVYRCPQCQEEVERSVHRCGTPAEPVRGLRFVDNDVVNFLGSAAGAAVGVGLAVL